MSKRTSKSTYPEIDEIKEDLNSLRDNVVELTKHVRRDGVEHAEEAGQAAKARFGEMKKAGKAEMKKIEDEIRKKPGQSLAIALAGGLVAGMLLRSRG